MERFVKGEDAVGGRDEATLALLPNPIPPKPLLPASDTSNVSLGRPNAPLVGPSTMPIVLQTAVVQRFGSPKLERPEGKGTPAAPTEVVELLDTSDEDKLEVVPEDHGPWKLTSDPQQYVRRVLFLEQRASQTYFASSLTLVSAYFQLEIISINLGPGPVAPRDLTSLPTRCMIEMDLEAVRPVFSLEAAARRLIPSKSAPLDRVRTGNSPTGGG